MPYLITAICCLVGLTILLKALPRARGYRQPFRYAGGICTIAASLIGWPLLWVIVLLPDKVNGPFLSFLALFGFLFTMAFGGAYIAKANNTARDDLWDDIGNFFS